MNCLVNHKGMPCSCDFSDNPNPFDMESELIRLREERDRYRKALEWAEQADGVPKGVRNVFKQALSGNEICHHGLDYCVRCRTEGLWSIGSDGEKK